MSTLYEIKVINSKQENKIFNVFAEGEDLARGMAEEKARAYGLEEEIQSEVISIFPETLQDLLYSTLSKRYNHHDGYIAKNVLLKYLEDHFNIKYPALTSKAFLAQIIIAQDEALAIKTFYPYLGIHEMIVQQCLNMTAEDLKDFQIAYEKNGIKYYDPVMFYKHKALMSKEGSKAEGRQ